MSSPRLMTHPLPPSELKLRENIRFLHPGYSISNTLLSLPRVDRVANTTTFGVHYQTALLACRIIAGNAFDTGRLTLDEEGQRPVDLLLDDILTERVYYFIIGDRYNRYPIVPSFQDWEFPHDRIPDSWPEVPVSTSSNRCGMSNFSFAIEEVHLVPQEETLWYFRNDMGRYGSGLRDINNPANILPLKSDLHRCFEKRWFGIVPKVIQTATPQLPQYASQILSKEASELWPTYHNTLIQYLDENARPYLFARFAWTILLQVKPMVIDGISRHVIRIQMSGEDKIERKEELLSGPQLKAYYGGGGTKRATPINKRSGIGSSGADDDDNFMESSSENGDFNMDNSWSIAMNEWKPKENERREQRSSETAVEEDNQAQVLTELKAVLQEVLPRGEDDLTR